MSVSLKVNPEDLLYRDSQPVYGPEATSLIAGKTVLVTGAGGSIGSEIVRQLERLSAKKVYCLDNDETALYELELGLAGQALLTDDHLILANVGDENLIRRIVGDIKPDVVFHAAAHKHLPILERMPQAAVRTNIFGTRSVAKACVETGVGHFVNISTDKAANPTSVLGWSKRLAEMVTSSYAHKSETRIASVRFGNVLGSRGSLLPTVETLLSQQRPITITHQDVTRYFMTIPEAAGLVIEAARLANGGSTFVLDMGTPVNIEKLVLNYARRAGYGEPSIVYTGLRPGEKLHEELFDSSEQFKPTSHPRIRTAHVGDVDVVPILQSLECLVADAADPELIRQALRSTY